MFSTSPPLILTHWIESPYIILVWSNTAFAYATGPNNKCCKFKQQDQIYASEEPNAFQKLILKNQTPVLIYNMRTSALSLQSVVKSIQNPYAIIYSLNQPVMPVHGVFMVDKDQPVDCMFRMIVDEVALKDLVSGTALTEEAEDMFPNILPDDATATNALAFVF